MLSLKARYAPYVVHWFVADKSKQSQSDESEEADSLRQGKRVQVVFYRTEAGGEPVREWLKNLLSREDRKKIGEDIKTVEFGWPVGMPVCRSVGGGIYEVRSNLSQNRIARVFFYFDKNGRMVLLHGFIKKTQKTPEEDLELARRNKKKHERLQ
ncbi:MAG TPA: type II toxin-antitoxin system RelE/ParE family toxin [Candidatus Saccharimonadales bacterium]|jgi:phage-related protein|nr:type II toxin-antitoxin system RelE/ParE family toxin [Candidatus Saccharimonadales bacterium]